MSRKRPLAFVDMTKKLGKEKNVERYEEKLALTPDSRRITELSEP